VIAGGNDDACANIAGGLFQSAECVSNWAGNCLEGVQEIAGDDDFAGVTLRTEGPEALDHLVAVPNWEFDVRGRPAPDVEVSEDEHVVECDGQVTV
jgi:hypothetical protein